MVRFTKKLFTVLASAAVCSAFLPVSGRAITLITPTEGQNVREVVKIKLPASQVPDDGFIAIYAGQAGKEQFIEAIPAKDARKVKGVAIFTWNTKSPYHDDANAKALKFYKDGSYSIRVEVHDATAKSVDKATVNINLKNQVARSNPAPAVKLVNRLPFGQSSTYDVSANVQVFDQVGLPVMGGIGLSSDFKILQSVEDVREDGELLLRYRIAGTPVVSSFGKRTELYQNDEIKPQLYRLVDKHGDVIKANMFSKQGKFTIMDVLPVLPKKSVREGDTWPSSFNLKLEGITRLTKFTGTSMLDSFEWQNGQKCAKIISNLSGKTIISLVGGNIRSVGDTVNAQVITYFAYGTGKMVARHVSLDFPATINNGLESYLTSDNGASPASNAPGVGDENEETSQVTGQSYPGASTGGTQTDSNIKKGSVQINVDVALI